MAEFVINADVETNEPTVEVDRHARTTAARWAASASGSWSSTTPATHRWPTR